ncbi:Biotin carboxylase [Ruaniaceae bacterium KH17]|nr:Biotin carboxylase [Ruaniaceae bacterium KH17]
MKSGRILILGAGRGQVGLIRAANSLGVETIVASLPSTTAPGISLADQVVYADIADPQGIVEAARDLNVSAIATSCADTGLPALGAACDELALVGLSHAAAKLCNDKLLMKRAFERHGVRTARFREVSTVHGLDDAIEQLGLPLVIKATDLQGSQGISIVRSVDEAHSGFEHARAVTKRESVIVEQFIEGDEFGAQALVHDGKIVFVMPHGDEVFMARTAVPVGHSVPLDLPDSTLDEVVREVEKAIVAVGIDNSAVNVDLIARGEEIFIIEITGRVGANGLPELVSAHFGIDYYEVLVRLALGEAPLKAWDTATTPTHAAAVRMLIAPEARGRIADIHVDSQIAQEGPEFTLFRRRGDELSGFTNSGDCVGQVVVRGETLGEALLALDAAERALVIVLESSPHE